VRPLFQLRRRRCRILAGGAATAIRATIQPRQYPTRSSSPRCCSRGRCEGEPEDSAAFDHALKWGAARTLRACGRLCEPWRCGGLQRPVVGCIWP
jgi:hypothetical protein